MNLGRMSKKFRTDVSSEETAQKRKVYECTCGNPEFGFNCVCDWVAKHPGNKEYSCEFCGIYTASKPRCNKCKEY